MLMSTLKQSLETLRSLAPKVNEAADSASRIVQQVEKMLSDELALGVAAEVTLSHMQVSKNKTTFESLCYMRVNGEFRICVVEKTRTSFVDDNNYQNYAWETTSETPWLECPRDTKLRSFPVLPDLLEAITEEAKDSQDKACKTEAVLREILGNPKK